MVHSILSNFHLRVPILLVYLIRNEPIFLIAGLYATSDKANKLGRTWIVISLAIWFTLIQTKKIRVNIRPLGNISGRPIQFEPSDKGIERTVEVCSISTTCIHSSLLLFCFMSCVVFLCLFMYSPLFRNNTVIQIQKLYVTSQVVCHKASKY